MMKKFAGTILILFICSIIYAQQGKSSMAEIIKNPPTPARLVNDYANILTDDQRQSLENKLVRLDDSTFTQIVVVIVETLDGYDVADAAIELGRSWGVGNKKNNSGVVLLVAKNDRKLNISPGYGLEGALTDNESSDIIRDIITPNFKGDDYYRGIDEGTDAIASAVRTEYQTARPKSGKGLGVSTGKIIFFIIIILFLLMRSGGNRGGGGFMSRRGYRGLGAPFIFPMGGGGGGGGWGGGSGGGGGFGGFGGGSFGGGGSSGSW